MKRGERYKNYNELKGLFTYEVVYKRKGIIFMRLFYPSSWDVPPYRTKFTLDSAETLLEKI
tara:strand:- start:167 stop:349 length:183 start_codon:yes stop_codon:yes gene_type:complete